MLLLGRRAADRESGRRLAEEAVASGAAFEKLRALVRAQGGEVSYVDDPEKLPRARFVEDLLAERSGYLDQLNARIIGEASVALGAGRAKKTDAVDHAVGFVVHVRVGDCIERGQPLITVHANDADKLAAARESLRTAFGWSEIPVARLPLFYD
jgi:pyrimidine-nucleoside phosphorylase